MANAPIFWRRDLPSVFSGQGISGRRHSSAFKLLGPDSLGHRLGSQPELPYREGWGTRIFDTPMASHFIQDLCPPGRYRLSSKPHSLSTQITRAEQQRRLLTVIQQAQLGLDYQAMLQAHPDLQHLIHQIQTLMPAALTTSQRHLRLNQSLQAPLALDGTQHWVHATVNLGYQRGVPKVVDWAVRRPRPCWADSVKLWVAAEHFQRTTGLNLNQLKLVVIALSFTQRPQSMVIRWNHQRHHQTQARIIQQWVNGNPVPAPKEDPELLALLDIRSIPEIAL